ncbi:MAG: SH3 domain-containing protein, partial [Gemmatimonadaceae bacterium]
LVTGAAVSLRRAPDAAVIARLEPGARVEAVAREREWIRVRVDGWVPASAVLPADTAMRADLSAADLRSDPEGTDGMVVRWEVQVLALQRADPLRTGLAPDEPYLLVRGPGIENALLYLAIPPSLLQAAREIEALSEVVITARVRDGRSEPVGVPVLDLITIARR